MLSRQIFSTFGEPEWGAIIMCSNNSYFRVNCFVLVKKQKSEKDTNPLHRLWAEGGLLQQTLDPDFGASNAKWQFQGPHKQNLSPSDWPAVDGICGATWRGSSHVSEHNSHNLHGGHLGIAAGQVARRRLSCSGCPVSGNAFSCGPGEDDNLPSHPQA